MRSPFSRAAGLLSLGSFALAASWSWLGSLSYSSFYLIVAFTWIGIGLHAWSWLVLTLGLQSVGPSQHWNMSLAFEASIILFVVGLATVPVLLPGITLSLYTLLLFPHVPTVFAPVVLFHVTMFAAGHGRLGSGNEKGVATAGLLILGLAASTALVGFLLLGAFPLSERLPVLAALEVLLGVGYALVYQAWRPEKTYHRAKWPVPKIESPAHE